MATATNPLLAIQTPQLIGICCGVAVFVSTIITVAVLFVKGGSIERLRAEAKGEQAGKPRPKLVDELLEAAQRLKYKPDLGTSTVVARTKKGEAPRRVVVRRADEDDEDDPHIPTTEWLVVVDASLKPEKRVGCTRAHGPPAAGPSAKDQRRKNKKRSIAPLALFASSTPWSSAATGGSRGASSNRRTRRSPRRRASRSRASCASTASRTDVVGTRGSTPS